MTGLQNYVGNVKTEKEEEVQYSFLTDPHNVKQGEKSLMSVSNRE